MEEFPNDAKHVANNVQFVKLFTILQINADLIIILNSSLATNVYVHTTNACISTFQSIVVALKMSIANNEESCLSEGFRIIGNISFVQRRHSTSITICKRWKTQLKNNAPHFPVRPSLCKKVPRETTIMPASDIIFVQLESDISSQESIDH